MQKQMRAGRRHRQIVGELRMAGCAAVTAFVSPGRFESEKAVLRVIGSSLNIIVDLSQGSRWRLRDAVEAVMTSENNGIWTALRCASRVSEKKESAPSTPGRCDSLLHQASACESSTMEPITLGTPVERILHLRRFAVGVSTSACHLTDCQRSSKPNVHQLRKTRQRSCTSLWRAQ